MHSTPILADTVGNINSRRRLEPLGEATRSLGLKDPRVTMRLIREGRLKAVKIGNRIFVSSRSLDEFAGC